MMSVTCSWISVTSSVDARVVVAATVVVVGSGTSVAVVVTGGVGLGAAVVVVTGASGVLWQHLTRIS